MTDVFSKEKRSQVMSRIRSTHTRVELAIKRLLKGSYLRYQPKIVGRPDFGNKRQKVAIFIDGCFWHKCPVCFVKSSTRTKFWMKKINSNVKRDNFINKLLRDQGWTVIRIWEHLVKKDAERVARQIMRRIT